MATEPETTAETELRIRAAAHLRRLFKLLGRTLVNIDPATGRARPELAPGDLWRMLPGIVRSACALAEECGIDAIETDGMRQIGDLIDAGRAPQTGGGK